MAQKPSRWKKGRGKLGPLSPLIGAWKAQAQTPMGAVQCRRTFTPILKGTHIQLAVRWEFPQGNYEEMALLGVNAEGKLSFWSFTSDGKNSTGTIADVTDLHPSAIGFEAQMPAGLARMAYWPDEEDGYYWVVEAKTKKGWKRFTEHHYRPA